MEGPRVLLKTTSMKARIMQADGYDMPAHPLVGKKFSLRELQKIVGGTICIHKLPVSKLSLVCNDDGKIKGLPVNTAASKLWQKNYPIEKYPHNNDGVIVGNVLVCDPGMVR